MRPKYDLGKNKVSSLAEVLNKEYMEAELLTDFQEKANNMKGDFRKKLQMLEEYYKNLNTLCSVKGETQEELREK